MAERFGLILERKNPSADVLYICVETDLDVQTLTNEIIPNDQNLPTYSTPLSGSVLLLFSKSWFGQKC